MIGGLSYNEIHTATECTDSRVGNFTSGRQTWLMRLPCCSRFPLSKMNNKTSYVSKCATVSSSLVSLSLSFFITPLPFLSFNYVAFLLCFRFALLTLLLYFALLYFAFFGILFTFLLFFYTYQTAAMGCGLQDSLA